MDIWVTSIRWLLLIMPQQTRVFKYPFMCLPRIFYDMKVHKHAELYIEKYSKNRASLINTFVFNLNLFKAETWSFSFHAE